MHRKPTRLVGYDYSLPGAYFVTICTERRAPLLAWVDDGELRVTAAGRMVHEAWEAMEQRYAGVEVDDYAVMPDHVHGNLIISEDCGSLIRLVNSFKSLTTRRYIDGVRRLGWPRFDRRLWQRSFHDRVLRDDEELFHAREYIRHNAYLLIHRPGPP